MESPDESPPKFARFARKKNLPPESQLESTLPDVLTANSKELRQGCKQSGALMSVDRYQNAEKAEGVLQTPVPMSFHGSDLYIADNAGDGHINRETDPSLPNAATTNCPAGMNLGTQNVSMKDSRMHNATVWGIYASGHAQLSECVNPVSLQQNHLGTPHRQMLGEESQSTMFFQQSLSACGSGGGSFRQDTTAHWSPHQQNTQYPYTNISYTFSMAPPNHHPPNSAGSPVEASRATDCLVAQYAKTPEWLGKNEKVFPANAPQPSNEEIISVDNSPKVSSQKAGEVGSPYSAFHELPRASQLTQIDASDNPSPDISPNQCITMQSGKATLHTQKSTMKKGIRGVQSPSIDVDDEENNFRDGINWPVLEDAIDLSAETNEEPKSKLKKCGGQKRVEKADSAELYKIPLKSEKCDQGIGPDGAVPGQSNSNNRPNPAVFNDPLNEAIRKPLGPPPRAFPKQLDPNPLPRRSARFTRETQLANTDTSPKDVEACISSVDLPGDHQVPLGGLPREKREKRINGKSYMNSNRSTAKRRRPNCARETNFTQRESAGFPHAKESRFPGTQDPKRRAKHDQTGKSRKKNSSTGNAVKVSNDKEIDDDITDEFTSAMRQRTAIVLSSRDVRKERRGDSPLSNTVGDGSHSDDDDIGAGGNELSSDDDATPPPTRVSRASRTQRSKASKVARVSSSPRESTPRGQASMGTGEGSLRDSDDDNFMERKRKSVKKGSREGTTRKSKFRKTKDSFIAPSSPIDLVTPPFCRSKHESVRRSPRNAKRVAPDSKESGKGAEGTDEDFADFDPSARGLSKTHRGTTTVGKGSHTERRRQNQSRKLETAECSTKQNQIEQANVEGLPSNADADSVSDSQEDEDSDAVAEFPSQEQGSQPIELKVRLVKPRKKGNPKVFPEREFKKLSPDELAIIRIAFIKRYPAPPSNMQAQGRYEAAYGTEMTAGMVQRTWETQLKPWSERWWKLYLGFNDVVRERKLGKPRNKDPKIKEREVKTWLEEYYREHGDARPAPEATIIRDEAQ